MVNTLATNVRCLTESRNRFANLRSEMMMEEIDKDGRYPDPARVIGLDDEGLTLENVLERCQEFNKSEPRLANSFLTFRRHRKFSFGFVVN